MRKAILIIFLISIICFISCNNNVKKTTEEYAREAIYNYYKSQKDTSYIVDSISVKKVIEFDNENYEKSLVELGSYYCNIEDTKIDSLINVKPSCNKYYLVYIYCKFSVRNQIYVANSIPMLLDENYNIIEYI